MTDGREPIPEPAPAKGKAARNERRKAVATMLNALGIAALITLGLQPFTTGAFRPGLAALGAAIFVAGQALMHYVLNRLED